MQILCACIWIAGMTFVYSNGRRGKPPGPPPGYGKLYPNAVTAKITDEQQAILDAWCWEHQATYAHALRVAIEALKDA